MEQKIKILHLEDLDSDAKLVDNILKKGKLNFETLVVDTKDKFTKALKDFSPDIILSDHSLPDFNSTEALAIFKKTGMKIPFILLTSTMSDEFAVESIKKGADDYILKDRLERLPTAIQLSLEKFRLEKERDFFVNESINSESRLRYSMDNMMEGVQIVDRNWKYIYVNDEKARQNKSTKDELIGYSMLEKFPGIESTELFKALNLSMKNGEPQQKEIEFMYPDKTTGWFDLRIHPVPEGLFILSNDITARKLAEEKTLHANRLYSFISQINQTLVHVHDEETVFKEACRIAVEIGKFESAWIGMLDKKNKKINYTAGFGIQPEDIYHFMNTAYVNGGPQDQVLKKNSYYLCNDVQNDLELNNWKTFAEQRGYKSFIVLPIQKSGNIVATFNIYCSELDFFDAAEIDLLIEASGDISFALDVFEKEKEKIKAIDKLKQSELRLKEAQAIGHIGNWEVDLVTNINTWSDEFYNIFGIKHADVTPSPENFLSMLHPDDVSYAGEIVAKAFQTNEEGSLNSRFIKKDGSIGYLYTKWIFEFDKTQKPIRLYGILQDITEAKKSEWLLTRSQSNLMAVIENTDAIIYSLDKDLKYATFNQQLQNSLKEAYGLDIKKGDIVYAFLEKLEPQEALEWKEKYAKALSGETLKFEKEFRIGEFYSCNSFSIHPIWEHNEIIGLSCFVLDITKQKKNEIHQKKITDDLIQRNSDLEQFSYIISHNLRAPVANILGLSALLKDETNNESERKKMENYLYAAVEQLDTVIKDLNFTIQIKRGINEKKEEVNLSLLVDAIKSSIQNLIEKEKVEIITYFYSINGIYTIRSYFHSIFYNLISNSIKYASAKRPPVIKIICEKENGKIIFRFIDNGIGIDLEKHSGKIFGLYKRFNLEVEGKGMGLFIVKTQVENLGGKITVTSTVDKGTEFRMEFDEKQLELQAQNVNNILLK